MNGDCFDFRALRSRSSANLVSLIPSLTTELKVEDLVYAN